MSQSVPADETAKGAAAAPVVVKKYANRRLYNTESSSYITLDSLAEMVRMLKPGGLLLIDDRSVPEDDFVDGIMNRLDWLHDESHVREYRPGEWRAMLAAAGCQVLTLESYVRHRPLSSLTERVSPHNVAQIHGILGSLSPEQRRKLALEEIGGQLVSNHWYVIIAARKNTD